MALTTERQTMPQRITRPLPVIGGIGLVSSLTDKSPSTIRRLETTDPTFPRSFKLSEAGDRQWVVAEVLAWLEAKIGRPLQAA
jgi:predicted DNA-binding transcriptional regulator AlpA